MDPRRCIASASGRWRSARCPGITPPPSIASRRRLYSHPLKENRLGLRLMCITAHPDDESGAFGGALLMAHQHGADTTVICLTEGRAASNRGGTRSDDELAAARLQEVAPSCSILGVNRYEVWKY